MASSPSNAWLRSDALIAGQWAEAANHQRFGVFNPYNGAHITDVPDMGYEDANRAVDAASARLGSWSGMTAAERSALLYRWSQIIRDATESLAEIMTLESGKPLAESKAEVRYAASFVDWFAAEALRIYGETIPAPAADRRIVIHKQPIGVAALITPWNFPAAMITRKAAAALAAGCTVVIKPAEQTPLSALALAQMAEASGISQGAFNVVTASKGDRVGQAWCENPQVRKLSFTGSSEVGQILYAQCARTIKKLSLELGGNAPFIVFADADLDEAVNGAMQCKFRNSGQTCVCVNRFLVHEQVLEPFTEKLRQRMEALKIGDGMNPQTQIGPLIDRHAVAKVDALVHDALQQGARLHCGGTAVGATSYAPTLLSNMNASMRMAQEEIFGPVAAVFGFESEQQALALANATEYGLAAYCYSRDYARVQRLSESLEFGIVGVNTGIISTEVAPFGGIKQSGLGREGSRHGIEEYLELKYVCLAGLS